MSGLLVTVVIPTLVADDRLAECLEALQDQAFRNFEIIVVDNSSKGLATRFANSDGELKVRVLVQSRNLGFGGAINLAIAESRAPFIATLNDDARPHTGWLSALLDAADRYPRAGMFASQVRMFGQELLDSAGMLICADGSSKQRGHLEPAARYKHEDEVLLPSASAALYRRKMLDEAGAFDEDFFLYCEDTDLGLRARWAGWSAIYVPDAIVEHHYSHSAGKASALKAYYVERNRLFTLAKNFPVTRLIGAPLVSALRYVWHVWYILRGRGAASKFQKQEGGAAGMAWFVAKAHFALLTNAAALWRKRKNVRRNARISTSEFTTLLRRYRIGARKVAEL